MENREKITKLLKFKRDKDFAIFSELLGITEELKKKIQDESSREIEVTIDKNDIIGPQGPVGPIGPVGPQGPIGVKGDAIIGSQGPMGIQGVPGEKGDSIIGPKGDKGDFVIGKIGPRGPQGLPPKHEWMGTSLRFENPDGTWSKWIDLKGSTGASYAGGGGVPSLTAGTGIILTATSDGGFLVSSTGGDASTRVLKAGDTMTGDLTMYANIILRSGQRLIFDG